MTTPARPGKFTGATDTASSGSYFGTTLLSGISDLVAADVASAQTSATNAATSATAAATSETNSSGSATVAQQFATNAHNTQFDYGGSNYYSALHYATEVSSQTSLATTARTDAQNFAVKPANTQFTYSGVNYYSALHYQALANTNATTASNYANKVNGAITGSEFSAKAWSLGGTGVTTTGSRGAAKEWATTTGGAVDTSDYSAKEYAIGTTVPAGSSKEWATVTGSAVSGGEYSAKEYAVGTSVAAGSAKEWATTAEDSAVSGGEYSAKHYSAKAAASATAAAGSSGASGAATSASTAEDHKDDAEAARDVAQNYATKIDNVVPSTSDNSAKAWAIGGSGSGDMKVNGKGAAKEWATYTTGKVDGGSGDFSAKEYAIGTHADNTSGSAKQWAIGGGSFNTSTVVAGGLYSAKYYAEQAAASADSFDDLYLGPKSSAPTEDNDGDALTQGDLYYHTSGTKALKVYSGSAWETAAVSTSGLPTAGFTIAMAIAL